MNTPIKIASIDDIKLMLSWAKIEGWNPGLQDAIPFHVADPLGFFIEYLDGNPVACISLVHYVNRFAFLGLYIVEPEFQRHHGYGFQLWKHVLSALENYNVGLDGVIDQQKNYQKSGFKLAHRNIRYAGNLSKIHNHNNVVIDARTIPFDILLEYDKRFFPSSRPQFLASWLAMPTHYPRVIIEAGEIKSFGVLRECHDGYKIGPLFSENKHYAELLLSAFYEISGSATVFLDVPERNKEGISLAEQLTFKPVFETARMYTQQEPVIDLSKVFGITTFELG